MAGDLIGTPVGNLSTTLLLFPILMEEDLTNTILHANSSMNLQAPMQRFSFSFIWFSLLIAFGDFAYSAEFFVNKGGSDKNDGLSREKAFLTIQKGVDALQAGDSLSIGPGEYTEAVRRDALGSLEKETLIQAEIPGTAILRGDVVVGGFKPLQGKSFVYVTDFDGDVQIINELDTLTVMERKQNLDELEYRPGSSFYDNDKKKLYISTTDSQKAETHRYSASIVDANGLQLTNPIRVTVDGLVARGFNSSATLLWDVDYKARRGIFLTDAIQCTIRRCVAFMNGGGLLIGTKDKGEGNVIEWSEAYGNFNPFSLETANINAMHPRGTIIRDCVAYRGGGHGIKVYLNSEGPPKVERCLAWGNRAADIFVKGKGDLAEVDHSVAPNKCLVGKLHYSTYGRDNIYQELVPVPKENIHFEDIGDDLDQDKEFADPENMDYHLQSSSKFRKAGPDGTDAGAYAYEPNIFYVKQDGDDKQDGLSLGTAWRSLDHALSGRQPGETVYLLSGTYVVSSSITLGKANGKLIRIMARGRDIVRLEGAVNLQNCDGLNWERINFSGEVSATKSQHVSFRNCRFMGNGTSLSALGTMDLRVEHSQFSGFAKTAISLGTGCKNIFLASNLFQNASGVAVTSAEALKDVILYCDYNGYADAQKAWDVSGKILSQAALAPQFQDVYSRQVNVSLQEANGVPSTEDIALATVGRNGKAIGFNNDRPRRSIFITGPKVHSVSDTTANISWATSGFASCKVAWGETPACENTRRIEVDYAGTFSLTGLEPGKTYYFKLVSVSLVDERGRIVPDAKPGAVDSEPLQFQTAKAPSVAKTYYVSTSGKDNQSGLSAEQPLLTISKAAEMVNKGDTVLIASGTYAETIRVQATGDKDAPITFRAQGGGKTLITGNANSINKSFVIAAKSDIHIDGLYFKDYVRGTESSISWPVGTGAIFLVSDSRNIKITRCFDDGRIKGYSPRFFTSIRNKNVLVKNSVFMRGFHGMHIQESEDVTIEHNIMFHNLIFHITLGVDNKNLIIRDNIITDNYAVKRRATLVPVPSEKAWGVVTNNCYFLRVPYMNRENLFGSGLDSAEWAKKTDSIFANPEFPVAKAFEKDIAAGKFVVDAIVNSNRVLDFSDFFATNPEVIKRNIGLIPADFHDFPTGKK